MNDVKNLFEKMGVDNEFYKNLCTVEQPGQTAEDAEEDITFYNEDSF